MSSGRAGFKARALAWYGAILPALWHHMCTEMEQHVELAYSKCLISVGFPSLITEQRGLNSLWGFQAKKLKMGPWGGKEHNSKTLHQYLNLSGCLWNWSLQPRSGPRRCNLSWPWLCLQFKLTSYLKSYKNYDYMSIWFYELLMMWVDRRALEVSTSLIPMGVEV